MCIHMLPRPPPTAGPLVKGVQESLYPAWEASFRRPRPSRGCSHRFSTTSPSHCGCSAHSLSRPPLPVLVHRGPPGRARGRPGEPDPWHHPALLLTYVGTWAGRSGALASGSSSVKWGQQHLSDVLGPGRRTVSLNAQLGGGPGFPPGCPLSARPSRWGGVLAASPLASHLSWDPVSLLSSTGSWGPVPRREGAQVGEAAARSGQAGSSTG